MVKTVRKRKHAVVPAVVYGTDGPNSLGFFWSLGPRGVPVYLLREGSVFRFIHRSRFCRGVFQAAKDESNEQKLISIAQHLGTRPVLFCTSDKAVLNVAANFDELSKWYYLPMPCPDMLVNLIKKDTLHAIAKKAGLRVPETHFPTDLTEAYTIAPTLMYPVIIKPTMPGPVRQSGFKTLGAETAEEFLLLAQRLFREKTDFMVQHYIAGGDGNVLVFMGASGKDGRLIAGCTGRKLRQTPPGAGVMASGELCELPDVYSISTRFLNDIGYIGLNAVEFKRQAGTEELYFIEVGARTPNYHRLAWVGGYDLPAVVYADTLRLPLPRMPIRQRKGKWIGFLWDFVSAWQGIKAGRLTCFDYIRTFAGRHEWAYFSWKDPFPWVEFTGQLVIKAIKKIATR